MYPLLYIGIMCILLVSCNNATEESGPKWLDVSGITLKIINIQKNSVIIEYEGNYMGSDPELLYRERNSNKEYQSVRIKERRFFEVKGLNKATEYEIRFQASDIDEKAQTPPSYFTTHAVTFDYDDFYKTRKELGMHNQTLIYSHLNKKHTIYAKGISDYDVNVYLVNEKRTDSVKIFSEIKSDTLSFVIPDDYLSQKPRESVKKPYVGVSIGKTYQYLYTFYYSFNYLEYQHGYSNDVDFESRYTRLKIYNDVPYIKSVTFGEEVYASCINAFVDKIIIKGEFLGGKDDDNITYKNIKNTYLRIFNAEGNLQGFYIADEDTSNCWKFQMGSSYWWDYGEDDYIYIYNKRDVAYLSGVDLPVGEYSAEMIVFFENHKFLVSNRVKFTKE